MQNPEFPHSVDKETYSFTNHTLTPFLNLRDSFNSDINIANHYTFSKAEVNAILDAKGVTENTDANALTVMPVIENGELKIYLVATNWNEDESQNPTFPGIGFPDGPPILKTKNEG